MHPILSLIQKTVNTYTLITSPSSLTVEKAFIHAINSLKDTPMKDKFWLCGGALLGYAREGALLKHDNDIDFHYWSSDALLIEDTLKSLKIYGFKYCYNLKNSSGNITQHTIKYKNVKIDFFEAIKKDTNIQWTCYTTKHWNRPARQFLNQIPSVELTAVEFYGVSILKPLDHDAYLTALYGDWQKPMKDYTYYIDSKAIISKEPWSPK